MKIREEKILVACRNTRGEADAIVVEVGFSQKQYDLGEHFDLAEAIVRELGYEGPFLAFDLHEQKNLMRAITAVQPEKPYTWDNDPEYPVTDWQAEVAADDTRAGYHDWVREQREQANEELASAP